LYPGRRSWEAAAPGRPGTRTAVRVLCVGHRYPPHHAGGYELQCASVVRALRRRGHDVHVLTSCLRDGPGGEDDPAVARTLPAFPAEPVATAPCVAAAAEARAADALEEALARVDPDVMCWWRMAEVSVSLLGRARPRPAVGVVCDPWPVEAPQRDPFAAGAPPDYTTVVDRWCFVSAWLRDRLAGPMGIDPARADVVGAGIDLPRLGFRRPRRWRGELLCAGRLVERKGTGVAVRALSTMPAARLHLVGGGPMAGDLRRLAGALGVEDRVVLHGPLPVEAMSRRYAAADALLFPAIWDEPWGLVPLEAMACGVPVIATGTGGSADYLRDGVNALLVPRDDPAALADAVGRLAEDAVLRARLAAGGRATAEAHAAVEADARVCDVLEEVAAGALQRSRPRRRRASSGA
jgi:glycosyltransferase involved in cell wall biosynthesis